MTDTEISRRLALAIGYAPEDVWERHDYVLVWSDGGWVEFDHRDERIIFRIAARYNKFPVSMGDRWRVFIYTKQGVTCVDHTCPATCIALAVIEASERGLLS